MLDLLRAPAPRKRSGWASAKHGKGAPGSKPYPAAQLARPLRVSEPEAAYGARGKTASIPLGVVAEDAFKMAAVEKLAKKLDVSLEDLMTVLGIVGRTAQRRKQDGELTVEESDRLYRVARIVHRAIEVLGSDSGACRWLKRPQALLSGVAPLILLGNDAGTKAVEDQLGRIEHGIFS